jgi:hypothetical protein
MNGGMIETFDRTPRSGVSTRRRRLVRIPALALVAVLAAAWAPCFACERPARADGSPGLATPASSCHGAGDTAASSCAPAVRAAGSAFRAPGVPPMGPPVLPACPPELRAVTPVAASTQLPRLAPLHRPPLYLLHESLLA